MRLRPVRSALPAINPFLSYLFHAESVAVRVAMCGPLCDRFRGN